MLHRGLEAVCTVPIISVLFFLLCNQSLVCKNSFSCFLTLSELHFCSVLQICTVTSCRTHDIILKTKYIMTHANVHSLCWWCDTHVRTCSRSSLADQCGALIWPYSSRCSLVVMCSKRTSYCMHTPSCLRTLSMLLCMSLPYTSMEPEDGPKRPVRRDLWKMCYC